MAGGQDLFINVDVDWDMMLVVNGLNGNWYCDDDGGDELLNLLFYWFNLLFGCYDIWVGIYFQGIGVFVILFIFELCEYMWEFVNVQFLWSGCVDIFQLVIYLIFSFNGGFLLDLYCIFLIVGGLLCVLENIFLDCCGYVIGVFFVQMIYNGYGIVYIYIEGLVDMMLVINVFDGCWFCFDDVLGMDVGLSFNFGINGIYDIYVGIYGFSQVLIMLMIFEIQFGYNLGGKQVQDWLLMSVCLVSWVFI